jgi:peptidoglycan-N-acetylglucosamine deacetylase
MRSTFPGWPDQAQAAVCLTYDDALPCHYEIVAPALTAYGLRGTFYTPIRATLLDAAPQWRRLVDAGHELGNHSVFHPCRRDNAIVRPRIPEWNDLAAFDLARLRDELTVANGVLHLIDGRVERTYGNTCHDTFVGDGDRLENIAGLVASLFVAGRGPLTDAPTDPARAPLAALGTTMGDYRRFGEWRQRIEGAAACGGLIILTFHGVGAGYRRLQVDADEHRQLLAYLQDERRRLWSAPVIEVARWLQGTRARVIT